MSQALENKFKGIIHKYYKLKKRIIPLDKILVRHDELYTDNELYKDRVYKPLYNKIILLYNTIPKKKLETQELILRQYQEEYVKDALHELNANSRCLIDAPTGSGKTKIAFVIQSRLIKSNSRMIYVFVSPLLRINTQCLKDSYLFYNTKFNTSTNLNEFEEIQVNSSNIDIDYKNKINTVLKETNKNILLSTTYKSLKHIFNLDLDIPLNIDLLILDEAHCIPSYVHSKNFFEKLDLETDYQISTEEQEELKQMQTNLKKKEWYNIFFNNKVKNRLYLTATPYNYQIHDTGKYGKHISKVNLGDLIVSNTLSELKTYIASVSDKVNKDISNYDRPDTSASIIEFIKNTNRMRICIFVNNKNNAKKLKASILECVLYKSFKLDTGIDIKEPILYLSGEDTQIQDFSNNETIDNFNDKEVRIIISCKKLSMGVDIPCIDSIIFADPRMNSVDISQCVGRGLRQFKYGENLKECCILLIKYMSDDKDKRNRMIYEYLYYLHKNNICKHERTIPEEKKVNTNNLDKKGKCPKSKGNIKELNIYDGCLELDLEYYEEYSKYRDNEDKKYINEDLLEYNNRKEEYNTIKQLCNKYNINTIDDYLKMIETFKDKNINKLTNPEIYFAEIKIPNGKEKIWHCWYELFGKDISRMPNTKEEWKVKVERLNLNNTKKYLSYCELNNDMPYFPKLLYNNMPDLYIILDGIFE